MKFFLEQEDEDTKTITSKLKDVKDVIEVTKSINVIKEFNSVEEVKEAKDTKIIKKQFVHICRHAEGLPCSRELI